MKSNARSRLITVATVATVAAFLAVLVSCSSTPRQDAMQRGIVSYLARNSQPLDLGEDAKPFAPTLLDVTGKTVFLLGEGHGYAEVRDLDLAMFKHLHRTAGVRYYLMEAGPSHAWFINRYFATGDEQALDVIFNDPHMKGTFSWTHEQRRFWQKVRAWNDALPEQDRVHVVGVDIEHQPGTAAACIRRLLPDAEPPESIRPAINRIIRFALAPDFKSEGSVAGELLASLDTNRSDYVAFLGDRLFDVESVARNLRLASEYYLARQNTINRTDKNAIREKAIFAAFRREQARLRGARFYGCWGGSHVPQRRCANTDWFATLLNESESPVAGQVLSIWMICDDCRWIRPDSAQGGYRTSATTARSELERLFACAATSKATLFRLDGVDSPFAKRPYLVPRPSDGGATTDYFQYVILLRNANPATPLDSPQ